MNGSTQRWSRYIAAPVFVILVLMFYYINTVFPIYSDDFRYSYIWPTLERTQGIWDVFLSQKEHYMSWAGRIVAISSVQYIRLYDKWVFDVVNALMYFVCIVAFCKIAKSCNFRSLAVVAALFVIGSSTRYLWLTAACVYLWMSAVAMVYLALIVSPSQRCKWVSCLLALVAGNSQETIGLALCATLFFYILLDRERMKNPAVCLSFLLLVIGTATNLFSPGNFARMGGVSSPVGLSKCESALYELCYISLSFIRALKGDLLLPCLLVIGSAIIHLKYYCRNKRIHQLGVCLLVGACVSVIVPVGAHCFYGAAFHGCTLFAALSISVVVLPCLSRCRVWCYCCVLLVAVSLFARFCSAMIQGGEGKKMLADYVIKQVQTGNGKIIIPPHLSCFKGFEFHNNYLSNLYQSEYLGISPYAAFSDKDEIAFVQNGEGRTSLAKDEISCCGEKFVVMKLSKEPKLITAVKQPISVELSLLHPKRFLRDYPRMKPSRFKPALMMDDGNRYIFFPLAELPVELKIEYADGDNAVFSVERKSDSEIAVQKS